MAKVDNVMKSVAAALNEEPPLETELAEVTRQQIKKERHAEEYSTGTQGLKEKYDKLAEAAQMRKEEMMETFGAVPMTKADILNEAIGTVGQRNESYDAPEDNFERIAHLWTAWAESRGWDVTFTPNDVSYMMILMKLGRLAFNPTHHDSIVDVAGYAGCAGQIASIERNK